MASPANKKKNLFSQSALERLQSPEQLDQLMRVTNSTGWLALIGIAAVLACIGVWSVVGTIPTKVTGNGILVKSGGIFLAVSQGSGQVEEIFPRVGDQVDKGTLLARISVPALMQQVENARERVKEVQHVSTLKGEHNSKDLQLRLQLLAGQRKTVEAQRSVAEEQVAFLTKKIASHRRLLKEGLITQQQFFATEQELKAAEGQLKRDSDTLKSIEVQETEATNAAQGGQLAGRSRVEEARRQLDELEEELKLRSEVRSPYSGRVVEITTDAGTVVNPGEPIVSIEVRGSRLEAVVYVSSTDGKKIRPGMKLFLSPSTVKKEEYGMMVGRVERVSEYPSTTTGMMALLENEQLVGMFSKDGPPIAVYADLDIDHYSHSGYRWTSGLGPPVTVSGGTVVTAFVTTHERTPIELLIPFVKSKLGL